MITLLTGLPGGGKTLRVLQIVEELCRKDNRPLFVMGVPLTEDFPYPWQAVPPVVQWTEKCPSPEDESVLVPCFTFPVGAVILLDEAQKVFRPRSSSSAVPDHVAAFETHRHEGIDFFLVTQHPMLLDSNIRRLTNRHIHMVRVFGAQAANIHEWTQVKNDPENIRANSQQKPWLFPKHIYKWYKSAEAHTVKFRPPLRAILLILGPVALLVLVWIAVTWFQRKADPKPTQAPAAASSPSAAEPSPSKPSDWFAARSPRLPGLPHTAPAYDQVTTPVKAPAPVGCAVLADSCRCWSDQGTVLSVSSDLCAGIARTGYFRDFDDSPHKEVRR
ncbi:zonular occludens toxin domain-containing protein [Azospira oryzae]|nr:zonular occludens toxin domain-containing protein [Azospira oryzae]